MKRDISGAEQLAISLRWVDESYEVYEEFIGLIEVHATDVSTLASIIKDTLIRCCMPISSCRGQAYDGAANIAGHLSGVAARIQDEPKPIFVLCLGHSINLCLQDYSQKCKVVRDALSIATELHNLINLSPKRLNLLNQLKELAQKSPSLKPLCPTRWTVRTAALDAILKNYAVICKELEIIQDDSTREVSYKAVGLLTLMEKFSTLE